MHRGGTGWREWLLPASEVRSPAKDEVRRHGGIQSVGVVSFVSYEESDYNTGEHILLTEIWTDLGNTCLHVGEGIGVLRVREWVKPGFTFKQGWALTVTTFLLLQCYNSSSCNGGEQLLLVFWLILGGHSGYSEYLSTLSNSVSLLCSWLVTVHLKGWVFTLFSQGLGRFSCWLVNHFKEVMKSTHRHRKKQTIPFL